VDDVEMQMDQAVGRLIREVTVLEIVLKVLAGGACRDTEWVDRALGSVAGHVEAIRTNLHAFPAQDHAELRAQLDEAQAVWDFRRALVHGRWTLIDPVTAEYVSERPLPKREAKAYTTLPDWEASDYPEMSLRFNLRSVLAIIERMRDVQAYLEANYDRWEAHLGIDLDDAFHESERARIDGLRRGPRL
jgi:hypothetical protein